MIKSLTNWLENRTGIGSLTKEALFERVPVGARWRYVWGSTLTFAIMVQFITGVFLWMAYSPSASTAWESVYYIQNEMAFGWLLRGIHHWTAQIMVVLLVFHLVQVVIDSAYRAPREFNFWFGVILLFITLATSLTGYLLPWDQKGFWATKVATNLAGVVPVIGGDIQKVVVGGSDYGHHTLTRFFALHAGVLPASLIGLIVFHIYLFRKHGITEAKPTTKAGSLYYWYFTALCLLGLSAASFIFRESNPSWVFWIPSALTLATIIRIAFLHVKGKSDDSFRRPRRDGMFWPDQILKDAIACFAVIGAVLFLVFWKGTELTSPADPSQPYNAARPDWYFMSLFLMLKFEPFQGELGLILGAIVVPSILATMLFMMPLIGIKKIGHWFNVVVLYILIGGFLYLTVMAFKKDASDAVYLADVENAHKQAERVKELIVSNDGIPPEGALSLLYSDPLTQGPSLFASNCASCHAYGYDDNGSPLDGNGGLMQDEQSAPDLKGVGSREWIKKLLTLEHYQSNQFFGNTKFKESSMAEFLEEEEIDDEDIALLSAGLSAEAKLSYQSDLENGDMEYVAEGFELLGEDGYSCVDCHKIRGEGGKKGPDLSDYMSRQWLIDFIGNSSHKRFYGEDNDRMPNFLDATNEDGSVKPGKLDLKSVELIVDWLRQEYTKSKVHK